MILQYHMVREDVYPPERANPSDAGLDLRYNPDKEVDKVISVQPGDSVLLQTGYRFAVPHGYMLEVKNRSGNAAKKHLLVGACVIDSGYDGEVFVNLHNVGREPQFIGGGMKIAQVVLIPVVHFRPTERTQGKLYDYPMTISNRGDGALGSTGA